MIFWLLLGLGITFTLIIYFNWVPLNTRYIFLLLLILGIIGSINYYQLEGKYLGINIATKESILAFGIVTAISGIALAADNLPNKIRLKDRETKIWFDNKYFYAIFSVPLQEFLTRSYPLAIFKYFQWDSFWGYIIFSAAIFSFSHIFLKNHRLLIYTFLMGAVWSGVFYFFQDFLSLCISHWILGMMLSRKRLSL